MPASISAEQPASETARDRTGHPEHAPDRERALPQISQQNLQEKNGEKEDVSESGEEASTCSDDRFVLLSRRNLGKRTEKVETSRRRH
jgi:hypothetical protein